MVVWKGREVRYGAEKRASRGRHTSDVGEDIPVRRTAEEGVAKYYWVLARRGRVDDGRHRGDLVVSVVVGAVVVAAR